MNSDNPQNVDEAVQRRALEELIRTEYLFRVTARLLRPYYLSGTKK